MTFVRTRNSDSPLLPQLTFADPASLVRANRILEPHPRKAAGRVGIAQARREAPPSPRTARCASRPKAPSRPLAHNDRPNESLGGAFKNRDSKTEPTRIPNTARLAANTARLAMNTTRSAARPGVRRVFGKPSALRAPTKSAETACSEDGANVFSPGLVRGPELQTQGRPRLNPELASAPL